MAQPQQNLSLTAPAFQGVNTEDSPLSQDVTFAYTADNAVIDQFGRLGSRKGFKSYVSSYDLSAITPPATQARHEVRTYSMVHSEGVRPAIGMDIEWFDSQDTSLGTTYHIGLVDLSSQTVKVLDIPAPSSSLSTVKGKLVPFPGQYNTLYYLFSGNSMMVVDPVGESVTYANLDPEWIPPQDDSGVISNDLDGDVACAAYGRLWVSGVGGNTGRIYYSSLENPYWWYDGRGVPAESQNTGGIIDVSQYWPNGVDRIKGIVAHNNMLVVFGRNSILLYGNPTGDPAAIGGIYLQDAIDGMGLVARDAVCSTGNDVLFVDDTGVRSLGRSVQEQSVNIGDLTANVRTAFTNKVQQTADLSSITLSYWPQEGLAVCNFSAEGFAYVLDQRKLSSTGGSRITTWSNVRFDRSLHVEDDNDDLILLGSRESHGLYEYAGGYDVVSETYKFSYQSNPLGFGDNVRQKFPKRMDITVVSRDAQTIANARWGFGDSLKYSKQLTIDALIPAYWGQARYGIDRYGPGQEAVTRYRVHTKGSGDFVVLGMEATLDGGFFSIQELNIQTLLGRIY